MSFVQFFFFLMIVIPTMYQGPRGLFLIVLLLGSAYSLPKLMLSKTILLLGVLTVVASAFFSVEGILLNAPGAVRTSTVFFFWPIIYLYFIGISNSFEGVIKINRTLNAGCSLVMLLNLFFLLNASTFNNPLIFKIAETLSYNYGIYEGMIEFNSPTLSIIPYFFSYVVMLRFIGNTQILNVKLIDVLIFLSGITLFLSGRRAFWMLIAIAPIMAVLLQICSGLNVKFLNRKTFCTLLCVLFFVAAIYWWIDTVFNVEVLVNEFMSSFDFNGNESNYLRKVQYDALTDLWKEHPLLGSGLGSYSPRCVRTIDAPWEYELTYSALLAHVGIIGFVLYSLSVLWIYLSSFRIVRTRKEYGQWLLPQIAGLSATLIASITNPYIFKFDFLWVLFLPIYTLNVISYNIKNNCR